MRVSRDACRRLQGDTRPLACQLPLPSAFDERMKRHVDGLLAGGWLAACGLIALIAVACNSGGGGGGNGY